MSTSWPKWLYYNHTFCLHLEKTFRKVKQITDVPKTMSDKKESINKNKEKVCKCVILQLWSWCVTCTLCRYNIKFHTWSGYYFTNWKIKKHWSKWCTMLYIHSFPLLLLMYETSVSNYSVYQDICIRALHSVLTMNTKSVKKSKASLLLRWKYIF